MQKTRDINRKKNKKTTKKKPKKEKEKEKEKINTLNKFKISFYGYLLIFITWIILLISLISFFKIWIFIIYPFSLNPNTKVLHKQLTLIFTLIDDYILKIWNIYVVFWWWSIISWCGLKLFSHSKGISN